MSVRERLEQEASKLEERLKKIDDALEGLRRAEALAAELMGESTNGKATSLRATLLRMVSEKAEPFTAPDLWQEVREEYPGDFGSVHKASVSAAVKELADRGEIKMLREGAGSRAAVYAALDYEEQGLALEEVIDDSKKKNGATEG